MTELMQVSTSTAAVYNEVVMIMIYTVHKHKCHPGTHRSKPSKSGTSASHRTSDDCVPLNCLEKQSNNVC